MTMSSPVSRRPEDSESAHSSNIHETRTPNLDSCQLRSEQLASLEAVALLPNPIFGGIVTYYRLHDVEGASSMRIL